MEAAPSDAGQAGRGPPASPQEGFCPAANGLPEPSMHANEPRVQVHRMVTVAIPQGYVGLQTAPSVSQAVPTVSSIVAGHDVAASGTVGAAELELHPADEATAATRPTAR